MTPFEKAIMEGRDIPFNEAADFFIGVRQPVAYEAEKTAGLTDPPDETGELEGQFAVPVENVAALMQTVINKAMTLMQASLIYSMSMRGPLAEPVRMCVRHGDYVYRDLIEYITKRANSLAGAVHVGTVEEVPPSTDSTTIAKSMIRGEQELIQALMALMPAIGCNPMSSRVKSYAASAQERTDDLWRALDPEREAAESQKQEAMEDASMEAEGEAAGAELPEAALEGAEPAEAELPEAEPATPDVAPEASLDEKAAAMKLALENQQEGPSLLRNVGTGAAVGAGLGAGAEGAALGYMGKTQGGQKMLAQNLKRGVPGSQVVQKLVSGPGGAVAKHLGRAAGKVGLLGAGLGLGAYGAKKLMQPKQASAESAASVKEDIGKAVRSGIMRGVSQTEKDITQDRATRGKRYGGALGSLAGGGAGAALGKRLIGGKKGAIAGLAAGYLGGGRLGKEVGTSADIGRMRKRPAKKTASVLRMRLKVAMMKMAEPPGAEMETEAPMSSPTDTQQVQPQNYLQAELLGQQAQQGNEAQFYQSQAHEAQGAAQQMEQEMTGLQGQMQELQMQADQAGQSIQQSIQQATQAQDEALKQTQAAANMRMGMQKMRAQMMEVASQDPAEQAAQAMQGGPPDPAAALASGDPNAVGGAPPSSPADAEKEVQEAGRAQDEAAMQGQQAAQAAAGAGQPAAPGGAPPEGSPPPGAAPSPPGLKAASVKTASVMQQAAQRLPWAVAGAGLGALHHRSLKGGAPELRAKVQSMQANPKGGFFNAMRLAVKKQELSDSELAEQYPGHSLATQSARGAAIGALAGPMIGSNAQGIAQHMKVL